MAGFYAARSRTIPPLPWSSFPPPFSDPFVAWLTQATNGRPPQGRSTPQTKYSAICRFTDTTADFYLSPGEADSYRYVTNGLSYRWENENIYSESFEPLGIRYYVFAIPTS